MLGFNGDTDIDNSAAGVTVRVVAPVTPSDDAVIVVWPAAIEAARPEEPAALLMVATSVFEELQIAVSVRSWVVSSVKVPMAVNCRLVPFAISGSGGVMDIDFTTAGVTVRVVVAGKLSNVADIVTGPPVP
jgi:hypothetical protein